MPPALALLGASAMTALAAVVAQVAQLVDNPAATIWAQAGSSVAAVSALAYIAKLFAQGKLVARDPAEVERTTLEREAKSTKLAEASQKREDRLWNLIEAGRHDLP